MRAMTLARNALAITLHAQAGVAGQERRCVRAARVRGEIPSRGAATAGAAAGRRHQLRVCAGFVQAQAGFRAAGPVSRSAQEESSRRSGHDCARDESEPNASIQCPRGTFNKAADFRFRPEQHR